MSLQKSFFRWVAFALGFLLTLTLTLTGVAFAAGGGWIFWDILNKMLASSDYTNPGDGTVKNALNLWGSGANTFQKVNAGQSCGGGQCIYGVDTSGNIQCH